MTVRRRVVVSGRVQGVFYRDTCRQVAQERGVSGSARNAADGTVEVILEGSETDVDAVIDWCRTGTSLASVDSVEISEEEPEGLSGFRTL